MGRGAKQNSRSGFSVIEALVVLMITGTALLLVFQIGVKGAETGFRLGNRALAAADAEPGAGSLRTIVRGARFGEPARPFVPAASGDARGFASAVSLDRAGVCGEPGPAGRMSVRLQATPGGDILTCVRPGRPAATLMDLRPTRARFSYSDDAAAWRTTAAQAGRRPPARRLYVRLTSDDGAVDIVEESASVILPPVVVAAPPVAGIRP